MHELAITESILEIAERHARAAGAGRVTDVHLVIGQLSSVVDDSVQFYWDFVSRGSIAEGAQLHFRRVPAVLQCGSCSTEYGVAGDELACPGCGAAPGSIKAGDEFLLEAIDVDEEPPQRRLDDEPPQSRHHDSGSMPGGAGEPLASSAHRSGPVDPTEP